MTITVLSKPSCVQCLATYRALDSRGIEYEIRDITEDEEALKMAKSTGLLQAPVVFAGEDFWGGFRLDKITELAEKLKAA